MTLAIREGNLLVIGAREYPIRSVADWTMSKQSASSFSRLATLSASTKGTSIASGKRQTGTTLLTGLKATPLDPVSPEVAETVHLETPAELLETFITDGSGFVHLIVEALQ